MEVLNKEVLERALRPLNGSLKNRRFYPPGHPSITNTLKDAYNRITAILERENPLLLGRVNDILVFGHHSFLDPTYRDILECLQRRGIEGVSFAKGLTFEEFSSFIDILYSDRDFEVDELRRELIKRSILHVTIRFLPVGNKYLEVYQRAVDTVKKTMEEIRLGVLPKTEAVMGIVEDMTELVLEDKNAMIGLTMIKDYDNYLFTHSVNVAVLSIALGDELGLDRSSLHQIGLAALLHDIGKTGVGEDIIKKPDRLSDEEWERIKEHPIIGFRIMEKMESMPSLPPRITLEHHLGYDMKGYPRIEVNKPHPYSMIVTICDTYDAITTLRPYQRPVDPLTGINRMKSMANRLLDPELLKTFVNMLGLYPVGTLVRLNTNEIGVIVKVNPLDNTKPVVKVIFDRSGKRLKKPQLLDLSLARSGVAIVASVDPLSKNIDVGEYLKEMEGS